METIYFQPKGMKPDFCEAGIIHESDPEHIWYLDEPCKISLFQVKIIPKENVVFDKKNRLHRIKKCTNLVHSDPDNSGHCIHCGFILDND